MSRDNTEKTEKKKIGAGMILLWILLALSAAGAVFALYRIREQRSGEQMQVPVSAGRFDFVPAPPEPEPEPEPELEPEPEVLLPEKITVAFAGDILFDRNYATGSTMASAGGFAACLDEEVLDLMRGVDLMVINNEFPYSDRGAPQENKQYTFRAPTATAAWLAEAGVDLAALANNHTFDYGATAFYDTLETLENVGMPYIGGGRTFGDASAPYVLEIGDFSIAILNATQIERYEVPNTRGATETEGGVFRCFHPEDLYNAVRMAKENYDYVIAFVHWGTEKEEQPDWMQLDQRKGLEEAGADLVIGAHPHVLQGFSWEGEMPTAYSLGNFLFTSFTIDTGIIEAQFDPREERLAQLKFYPMKQEGCRVKMLHGAEKERVLEHLRELSPHVLIDEDGVITKE